jgi:hypothetical protein
MSAAKVALVLVPLVAVALVVLYLRRREQFQNCYKMGNCTNYPLGNMEALYLSQNKQPIPADSEAIIGNWFGSGYFSRSSAIPGNGVAVDYNPYPKASSSTPAVASKKVAAKAKHDDALSTNPNAAM